MTKDEALQLLNDMRDHFDSGFSYQEQQTLEALNYLLFKKSISNKGCQDCYRDAYIILTAKIKDMNELPQRSAYILKAGIVKHKPLSQDYYVLDMPEEAAESWLHDWPESITDFQVYPEDWQERVAARYAETKVAVSSEQSIDFESAESTQPVKQKRGRRKA